MSNNYQVTILHSNGKITGKHFAKLDDALLYFAARIKEKKDDEEITFVNTHKKDSCEVLVGSKDFSYIMATVSSEEVASIFMGVGDIEKVKEVANRLHNTAVLSRRLTRNPYFRCYVVDVQAGKFLLHFDEVSNG